MMDLTDHMKVPLNPHPLTTFLIRDNIIIIKEFKSTEEYAIHLNVHRKTIRYRIKNNIKFSLTIDNILYNNCSISNVPYSM